jgi:hypothetical protein
MRAFFKYRFRGNYYKNIVHQFLENILKKENTTMDNF